MMQPVHSDWYRMTSTQIKHSHDNTKPMSQTVTEHAYIVYKLQVIP